MITTCLTVLITQCKAVGEMWITLPAKLYTERFSSYPQLILNTLLLYVHFRTSKCDVNLRSLHARHRQFP